VISYVILQDAVLSYVSVVTSEVGVNAGISASAPYTREASTSLPLQDWNSKH
jgi:hypothetical protein